MKCRFVSLLNVALLTVPFSTLVLSALPPGYEEEMYCPADSCLRPRLVKPGMTGPRTMFYECYNAITGGTSRPRGWGVKVGDDYKAELLSAGWHSKPCSGEEEEEDEERVGDDEEGQEEGLKEGQEEGHLRLDSEWSGDENRRTLSRSALKSSEMGGKRHSCNKNKETPMHLSFGKTQRRPQYVQCTTKAFAA